MQALQMLSAVQLVQDAGQETQVVAARRKQPEEQERQAKEVGPVQVAHLVSQGMQVLSSRLYWPEGQYKAQVDLVVRDRPVAQAVQMRSAEQSVQDEGQLKQHFWQTGQLVVVSR